ncbi:phage integrase SAM-like domain-containing protein [Zobellia nedashkovskayae]|uniref:phage integrase SAM-like domain-containing protein n=1 Tax=Zobellia nedashkovskayae TaxID=2779510 RepID=UPI00188D22E5|nr:phage integrase SAM-like domain-containing protein [Zobellia nedashkovskayae]
MATINFLYRSTKQNECLNVRLLFRVNNKDYVQGAKTKLTVYSYDELANDAKLSGKKYWDEFHLKRNSKDIDIKNKQREIDVELNKIENHILNAFRNAEVMKVTTNTKWLKETLERYYNPPELNNSIPNDLMDFFDYYLEKKGASMSAQRKKNTNVTKHKLEKFQNEIGKHFKLNEINENFLNQFTAYSDRLKYAPNTQQIDLSLVKTICRYAKYLEVEIHPQMDSLKIPGDKPSHIFLNESEIRAITNLTISQEYLDNARDWLVISCYLGQRVSDFMRFDSSMIRIESGKRLIEFKQQKTKKFMTIPLSKEVQKILNKRNGNFPRAISAPKFNNYIKEICRRAEINEICKGKKRISISPEGIKPKREDYRDVKGEFEKWELVSSHIGRRSFATNFYGKIPTTFLINITGHSSEKMFLNYIKKSNKDLALESYAYFN